MKWTDEAILRLQTAVVAHGCKWKHIADNCFPELEADTVRAAWKRYRFYAVPLDTKLLPKPPRLERLAIIGDTHIPFQDEQALELTFDIIDTFAPTNIIHLGDLCDMHELSVFAKHFNENLLAKEIRLSRLFLTTLNKRYPGTTIRWIFGNHEFRFDRFIAAEAKELMGLRGMSLVEQIEPELHDVAVSYSGLKESYFEYKPNLLVGHWNKVLAHSAYTAKNLLRDVSLVQGHTHRLGAHFKNGHSVQLAAWENGCLCRLDPQYVLDPNWQQGFSLVVYDNKYELFSVRQVAIQQSGKLYWAEFNGDVYER